jgi:Flp pilus assembly pilin Flp
LRGRLPRSTLVLMPRFSSEDGQAIVEYGLIIGGLSLILIASVIITPLGAVFTTLVDNIGDVFTP